jgi:molybdopterin synthase catalytic subunit
MIITGLQLEPFDVGALVDQIRDDSCGAVTVFEGVTRSNATNPVESLLYEAWEPRANAQLREIASDALERWPVFGVVAVHRIGHVPTGKTGVVVVVSSAHRDAAFGACREVIDRIKSECAIWKKEVFVDGTAQWVGVS